MKTNRLSELSRAQYTSFRTLAPCIGALIDQLYIPGINTDTLAEVGEAALIDALLAPCFAWAPVRQAVITAYRDQVAELHDPLSPQSVETIANA